MKRIAGCIILCLLGATLTGCAGLRDYDSASPVYKNPSDLYDRAFAAHEGGQYAKARDLFHEYIGEFSNTLVFKSALYYLAHCYQKLGEDREALVLYSRIVDAYGEDDFWGAQAMKRIQQIKEGQ
ncbi:MAG: tetratricopeptide repeat protein [Candidatus Omnitrophica bacterium]|nr:tetratricopeptide repeat protein [Candidatus Omnitrophota bacterium]